jgi:hypothetical protein
MTHALLASLTCITATLLSAQSATMPPPPLMMLVREDVKPGRGAAHAASEAAWTRALIKGKSSDHYLGMTSMTGASEAWFIMGYGSYAEWEAKQAEFDGNPALKKEVEKISQQDGDLLTGTRTFLGALRKDLSFGPDVEIGKMRYFRIRTFRIRQGQNEAFEGGMKQAIAGYGKSGYPFSFACYEVAAGSSAPTYIILRPMKSLAQLDQQADADKAFQAAMGEEALKGMRKVFTDTVQSVENQLLSFSPKLSFPGPSTLASDPAFWTVKPDKPAK